MSDTYLMRKSLAILAALVALGSPGVYAGVITFTDVSVGAGITESRRGRECTMVDFDLDRDLDIMVWNALNQDDQLYENMGNSTFVDVASTFGILGAVSFHEERGSGFADYNNDQRGDVFVSALHVATDETNVFFESNSDYTFSEIGSSVGIRSDTQHLGPVWSDVDEDGFSDIYVGVIPEVFTGIPGTALLFINVDGLTFIEQASSAGVAFDGNGQAHLWWDWEDDGDQDLYIGVYFDSPTDRMRDRIYRNDGTGHFTWEAAAINSSPEKAVETQLADFDSDGLLEILVIQEDTVNVLWRDNGDGTFTNIAPALNLEMDPPTPGGNPELKTDAVVADFDNDMDPDVFVTWRDLTVGGEPPNQLWINEGGTYVEVGASAGFTEEVNSIHCSAGDLNGDGFLDIYVVNNNGFGTRDTLYLNDGNSNHWFEIDPVGSMSNRDAIGLKVWLTAGGVTQVQELYSTTTQPTRLHFGLASNEVVDELVLRWPRGLMETYEDLPADQVFRPLEGATSLAGQIVVIR
ncbi:CRTAC1 family protein [Candidatus Sumerlaeota bacterium]|nr:CRTAC1 family protein [Candidatus Sumerlaeota bacterium]